MADHKTTTTVTQKTTSHAVAAAADDDKNNPSWATAAASEQQLSSFVAAQHTASLSLDCENSNDLLGSHRIDTADALHPISTASAEAPAEISVETARVIYAVLRAWLGLDVLLGVLLGLYAAVELFLSKRHQQQHEQTVIVVWTTTALAAVLLLRSLAAFAGMYSESCQRCGLLVSAQSSVLQAAVNTILAMICAVDKHHRLVRWLYDWLPQQQHLFHFHHLSWTAVAIAFVVWAAAECARWQLLLQYRRFLLQQDRAELLRVSPELSGPTRRPWWWNHPSSTVHNHHSRHEGDGENDNNDHTQPLLFGSPDWVDPRNNNHHAEPEPQRSWFSSLFFGGRRRRNDNHSSNSNPRDSGSVDFASVQSEWASRTEEDPFWWSRDEHEMGNHNMTATANTTTTASSGGSSTNQAPQQEHDISWADEPHAVLDEENNVNQAKNRAVDNKNNQASPNHHHKAGRR